MLTGILKKTTFSIQAIDTHIFPAPVFENFTTFTNTHFERHCFTAKYYFRQPKKKKIVLQKGLAI